MQYPKIKDYKDNEKRFSNKLNKFVTPNKLPKTKTVKCSICNFKHNSKTKSMFGVIYVFVKGKEKFVVKEVGYYEPNLTKLQLTKFPKTNKYYVCRERNKCNKRSKK